MGARLAKYPLLVFLDSDVEILPGALQKLFDGLEGDCDVVGGVYEVHNSNDISTLDISRFLSSV